MRKKDKFVSELRFKGFEDDWKSVKLKSVFEELQNRNGTSKKYEMLTLSSIYGIRTIKEANRKDVSSKDKSNYKVVENGCLVCNKMLMWENGFGVSKVVGIISPAYYVLRTKNKHNVEFFDYTFRSKKSNYIFELNSQGLGRKRTMGIKTLLNLEFKTPTTEEQNKISTFLSNIDKRIKLLEEIRDLKKQYKKGLLQQMFVSNSAGGGVLNVPSLRFKEFEGDWKIVKLENIFTSLTEKNNGTTKNILSVSANKGMVSQKDVFSKRIAGNNIDKYNLIRKGNFVYNRSRSSKNPWGVIKCLHDYEMGVVSSVYFCLETKSGFDNRFLENYFSTKTFEKELGKVVSKSVRALLNVTKDGFLSLIIKIPPTIEEQIKISTFLKQVNNDYNKLNKELETSKQWKKGLLQRLFV